MDTVSVPLIRTLHHTLCVHKGDQANSSISITVGNPLDYLSGEFTSTCLKQNTTVTKSFNSSAAVHCSGVSNQLSQEHNETHPEVGVPGFYGGHETMRIVLPPHKIDAIQKEASQLLSAENIQIRTKARPSSTAGTVWPY